METPLQITIQNVPRSDALEARIRESAAKLELFHPRITSCRVAVDELQKHPHQGRQFRVRVEVHAPGREHVVATLQHHEDVYVALRDAFDAARRQLQDEVREARGDVKRHAEPRHGRVARLDAEQGFGFIETDEGDEVYFSRENVVSPSFDRLEPGTEVQFIEEAAGEGVQARRVSAGKHRFGA
ncbi:MAG TPA: HPF/RaiA family ribosome-associated protein [Usitatibacter sp.]|nr:HPF/RaiA family ribosome-associated protein [Usitatibacter sp.]